MSYKLTSRKETVGGPLWHCNSFLLLENAREKHCQHLPEEEFHMTPALSLMNQFLWFTKPQRNGHMDASAVCPRVLNFVQI